MQPHIYVYEEKLKKYDKNINSLGDLFKSRLLQKSENFRVPFTRARVKINKGWCSHDP